MPVKSTQGRPDDTVPHAGSPQPSLLRHNLLFMTKFFRHGTRIASVWPSSRFMAAASLKSIDWDQARVIVELGAGTGPITQQALQRLQPHTRFIAIERDRDFVRILRQRFAGRTNVEIIHGDVGDLAEILSAQHVARHGVDHFVSGLGTPSLPEPVQRRMFAAVRDYLKPHGVFSNITEVPWFYMRWYKAMFEHVSFQLVALNMPPGGVYHCRLLR